MRGSTFLLTLTKTDSSFSVDLREKRNPFFYFLSLLVLSLPFLFCFFVFFSFFLYLSTEFDPILFSFLIFLFYLSHCFLHLTFGSMRAIHTSAPHVMACVTPLRYHVASTGSCHVSPDTRCLKKHEIPIALEFDEIRRGN